MQYHKRLQHSSATHNLPLCPLILFTILITTSCTTQEIVDETFSFIWDVTVRCPIQENIEKEVDDDIFGIEEKDRQKIREYEDSDDFCN